MINYCYTFRLLLWIYRKISFVFLRHIFFDLYLTEVYLNNKQDTFRIALAAGPTGRKIYSSPATVS
jgi:hypothetical protein